MNTIKTWIARCHADGESATDAMQAEITELRERVAYLESYTESQKDAMRVTMDELASVREALRSTLDDLGQLTQRYMELRRTMREHKNEREALQAKLSAIEGQTCEECGGTGKITVYGIEEQWQEKCLKCEAAPVAPAQPVNELVEALETIAYAGMSGSGQESEEALTEWRASRAWEFISIAARALEKAKAAQPLTKEQDEAEEVLTAMDSCEWSVHRIPPSVYLTDEKNREIAWAVKREAAPYADYEENRQWTGPTAIAALRKGKEAIEMAKRLRG